MIIQLHFVQLFLYHFSLYIVGDALIKKIWENQGVFHSAGRPLPWDFQPDFTVFTWPSELGRKIKLGKTAKYEMTMMTTVTRKNWSDDLGVADTYLRLQTFRPTIIPIRPTNPNHDDNDDDDDCYDYYDDNDNDEDNDSDSDHNTHPFKQHQA